MVFPWDWHVLMSALERGISEGRDGKVGEVAHSSSGHWKVSVPEKRVHLSPWLAKFMMGWPPVPLKRSRKERRMTLGQVSHLT